MNHYSKCCRSKEIHNLQEVEDSDPESSESESPLFVYSVETKHVPEDEQFYETIEVEDTKVRFHLDSGAKANVMSMKTYSNLKRESLPLLKKTSTVLISFSKHKLKPRGTVVLTAKCKGKIKDVKFFAVEPEVESVLSGNTCVKLGLLKRVHQMTRQEPSSLRINIFG